MSQATLEATRSVGEPRSAEEVPATPAVTTTRLVLVDDHAIVRQGLSWLLGREPDLQVVGEAGTFAEAIALVGREQPDVVVLDLKLSAAKDTEGLDLCAELTARFPRSAVLVLTTFIDDGLVLQAVRAGARGYVVKEVDTSALVRAVRDVARGGSAFDPRSAAAMVRSISAPPSAASSRDLTAREQEVLQLLARGLSNRDIGARLYVSEATAKFHVGNILRKLGASGRAEAVYAATKLGVL